MHKIMNPTSQRIYNEGQQMANQFNQQAAQYGGQYEGARQSALSAQNELQDFTRNMQDPAQMYSNYLGQAQRMYGFNPTDLLKANKALANTNTVIANLPQAVQQQGNYYGTTAGAMANNYAQQAGNLQAVLAGQGNAVNAYRDVLGATQQQANQQTGFGVQGQQLKSQNLQNAYENALSQQNAARDQMQFFSNLYQQQGGLSASQAAQYAAAQASYASAGLAAAQAAQAYANTDQIRQQIALAQEVADKQRKLQSTASQKGTVGVLTGKMQGSSSAGLQGGR